MKDNIDFTKIKVNEKGKRLDEPKGYDNFNDNCDLYGGSGKKYEDWIKRCEQYQKAPYQSDWIEEVNELLTTRKELIAIHFDLIEDLKSELQQAKADYNRACSHSNSLQLTISEHEKQINTQESEIKQLKEGITANYLLAINKHVSKIEQWESLNNLLKD